MVDSDDFNTSAASVEDCKFEKKKLAANRARKYRQKLKTTNPEKYEQQLLKNKSRRIEFRKRSRSSDETELLKEKQNLRARKSYDKSIVDKYYCLGNFSLTVLLRLLGLNYEYYQQLPDFVLNET